MPPHTTRLLIGLALAACGHSAPGASDSGAPTGPFEIGEPLRLTYSAAASRDPSWSPDQQHVLYAFLKEVTQRDSLSKGCAGLLPAGGGSRVQEFCDTRPTRADTGTTVEWPALARDGRLAMIRQRWRRFSSFPSFTDLAIQPPSIAETAYTAIPVPYYSAATSRTHWGLKGLQWLDSGHLLYIAQNVIQVHRETLVAGIAIVVLDPAEGVAGAVVVPGTTYASSVTPGATPDTIYYTIMGDSMVYRRSLSTGTVDTVADFGGLGIARDVQVRAGRLIAVVGGQVSTRIDPYDGYEQSDLGGPVYRVDLPAGPPLLMTDGAATYRHLALAPDGASVVAERGGDLWRIALP